MDINILWNKGKETDWQIALENYYKSDSAKRNKCLEERMKKLKPAEVEHMTAQQFYSFLYDEYFVWKYTDARRLKTTRNHLKEYEKCGKDKLGQISCELFKAYRKDHNDTRTLMRIVRQINGLGPAGASGLLAILFPKSYGTVDQFAVKSLLSLDSLSKYNVPQNLKLINLSETACVIIEEIYRSKAEALNKKFKTDSWTPRKIDMVLWAYRE